MKASDALALLRDSRKLRHATVKQPITFIDEVDHEIHCTDCHFDSFRALFAEFKHHVRFKRCTFQHCNFYSAYFLQGLYVSACEFNTTVEFAAGGQNAKDCNFEIRDSVFHDFVDFGDCWFEGPVIIDNVGFRDGTNLLGNASTPIQVTFDYAPIIENTQGQLDIDTHFQNGIKLSQSDKEGWNTE